MAIYDIFENTSKKEQVFTETFHLPPEMPTVKSSSLFSAFVTRLCFLLLLIADLAWMGYALISFILSVFACLLTGFKWPFSRRWLAKAALSIRRAAVCGLSLIIGLFSPSFGIMVACTYFLMYDKEGIDEVVPGPFQSQFRDLFPS